MISFRKRDTYSSHESIRIAVLLSVHLRYTIELSGIYDSYLFEIPSLFQGETCASWIIMRLTVKAVTHCYNTILWQ